MGKAVANVWRASQEFAHAYWLASSLGVTAMIAAVLAWFADKPPEIIAVSSVIIFVVLAVGANAVGWLHAEREYKRVLSAQIERQAESNFARRVELIQAVREKVAEHDRHTMGNFFPWIETSAVFFSIRPHLNLDSLNRVATGAATINFDPTRGVFDPAKDFFISEIERLAKEWNID